MEHWPGRSLTTAGWARDGTDFPDELKPGEPGWVAGCLAWLSAHPGERLPFGEFGDAVDVYQIAHEIIMGYYAQAEGDSGGKLPPRAYPGCIFRGLGPGAGCRHLGGQMANGINRDGQEGTIRALREAVGVPPDQDSRPDRWLWRPEPEIPPGASEIYAALRGPVVP